jgi:hypothetical protein
MDWRVQRKATPLGKRRNDSDGLLQIGVLIGEPIKKGNYRGICIARELAKIKIKGGLILIKIRLDKIRMLLMILIKQTNLKIIEGQIIKIYLTKIQIIQTKINFTQI